MKKSTFAFLLFVILLITGNVQAHSSASSEVEDQDHRGHSSHNKKNGHRRGINLFHRHHHHGRNDSHSNSYSHHGRKSHGDKTRSANKK